jgi:hypothetical protein
LDSDQRKVLEGERLDAEKNLLKFKAQITKIIERISLDQISDSEADTLLNRIREQVKACENRISEINQSLDAIPDPLQVRKLGSIAMKVFVNRMKSPYVLSKMTFEEKRKLIEHAFNGRDINGDPLGVYVTYMEDKKSFEIEIRGLVGSTVMGMLEMDDSVIDSAMY